MDQVIQKIMRELSKSNPQGHVHAQELYAAVNMIRRCPPGPILHILSTNPAFRLVGDLYFRLDNVMEEE
jgi:N12 class adenine-specific DNA methylase